MKTVTDIHILQVELMKLGYKVPTIVVSTWGRYDSSHRPASRRTLVERWIRWLNQEPWSRFAEQPEFLKAFAIKRRIK